MTNSYLFKSCNLLDARNGVIRNNVDVLVENDLIKEIADTPIQSQSATVFNLDGKTLMPGLIDCHVHVFLSEVDLRRLRDTPLTLMTAKSAPTMRRTLMRGFTTVRDTGGADAGIRQAVADGLLPGPRLFIAGPVISQTGGHGDWRQHTESHFECACCSAISYNARIADGVPEMIKTVRDVLRTGSDFIKLTVSGGVASQSDPLESVQFREDEIQAACEEASRWGTYVAAHAYSTEAIIRAVNCGVRTIEHGNILDKTAADVIATHDAFVVPTLVTYDSMSKRGKEFGMSEYSLAKNKKVLEAGLRSIELCRDAKVSLGFGTDLLGQLQDDESNEFTIRTEVEPAADVLRSATVTNARILKQEGKLGEIAPGALADLLVIDGNPLADISVLQRQGANISLIMKAGQIYKNTL